MKFLIICLALTGATYGADLFCNFGTGDPFPKCSSIFNMTALTSANENINIVGQPADYVDTSFTYLDLNSNYVLNYIPTQLFKYFPNIQTFSATNTSTIALMTDSFNNCQKLNSITLKFNNIPYVGARFASNCHFVEYLYLTFNKIQTIDEKAFEGLESLRYLYLANNDITCLAPSLFKSNLGMGSIDLSYNKLPAVHSSLFKELYELSQIYLNNNNIGYISNFDLLRTSRLNRHLTISMENNPIVAINPNFMTELYTNSSISDIRISFSYEDKMCVATENYLNVFYIESNYWPRTNAIFNYQTSCYSNWNSDMDENKLITCGCSNA